MKNTIIAVIVIAALGIAYWLIPISFNNKKVSEEPGAERENPAAENFFLADLFEGVEVVSTLEPYNIQERVKTFKDIEFTLTTKPNPAVSGVETLLTYNLMIDGRPASDMQTQDGVYGKAVAVHRESLELVTIEIVRRVTPHGTLEFRTTFPKSGEYIIFTQFKRNSEIITTDFDVLVR